MSTPEEKITILRNQAIQDLANETREPERLIIQNRINDLTNALTQALLIPPPPAQAAAPAGN